MLVFNRPEPTAEVFAQIARMRPRRLLLVADGPRENRRGEAEACEATRAIVTSVDWPCEVETNFAESNLGCKRRVASGLDWVFQQCEEAIILEDDCVPHPSFFPFCEEMLARYRDDQRVGHIGGANFQLGRRRNDDSYYFSHFAHIWGWASWRRAWNRYDVEMKAWPALRDGGWLDDILDTPAQVRYWTEILDKVASGGVDTWDYQLMLAHWIHGSLTVLPSTNLVRNIGFGPDATHTVSHGRSAFLEAHEMKFPLQHPQFLIRDKQADDYSHQTIFHSPWDARLKKRIKQLLGIKRRRRGA
ncbi:MAG: hemolytic protein HlpA-like protein [Planctomycetaceae bacterium]|nr:hemolytic protein HlpA-like protein [Planctomycetaceae bacterium]